MESIVGVLKINIALSGVVEMSNEILEEKWKAEHAIFREQIPGYSRSGFSFFQGEMFYLAGRKAGQDEIDEARVYALEGRAILILAQEEIQKRDAEIVRLREELENFAYDIQESNIENCDECCNGELLALARKEIEKRDELLEQAKIIIDSHQAVTLNPFKWDSCAQWLKQYEELKK